MRNIARALKHQKLRRTFPKGVVLSVVQTGMKDGIIPIYVLRATTLHNNRTFDVQKCVGFYAIAFLTNEMWAMETGLQEAGVYVKTPEI